MRAEEPQSIDIPYPALILMMFPYRQPAPDSDPATVGVCCVFPMPAVVGVGNTAPVVVAAMVAQADRQVAEVQQMATAVGRPAAHRIASRSIPAALVAPVAVVAVVLRFPRYSLYRYIYVQDVFYCFIVTAVYGSL